MIILYCNMYYSIIVTYIYMHAAGNYIAMYSNDTYVTLNCPSVPQQALIKLHGVLSKCCTERLSKSSLDTFYMIPLWAHTYHIVPKYIRSYV